MKPKTQINDGRLASRDDAGKKTTLINLYRVGLRKGEAEIREDGEVIIRGKWIYIGGQNIRLGIPASRWVWADASIYREYTPEQKVDAYWVQIFHEPELFAHLHKLRGCALACWHAPKPCHGEVLIALADAAFKLRKEGKQITKELLFTKAGFGEMVERLASIDEKTLSRK
jgi:Domain of unknown function (DUF4326)